MLVHGTWGSDSAWYQPCGDFHAFLGGLRNDLYAAPDFQPSADSRNRVADLVTRPSAPRPASCSCAAHSERCRCCARTWRVALPCR
jgi:hypothetical protein